jgi:hypothetical protein
MTKENDDLVALACRPDGAGFWYRVRGRHFARFWFTFIALGVGGHQAAGEVSGAVSTGDWQYHALHFPVMHVGYTSLDVLIDGRGERLEPSSAVSNVSGPSAPTLVGPAPDERGTYSSPFPIA